jgi:hypothetical protein
MSVDDILFEPIGSSTTTTLDPDVDTQMIDAVKIALTGVSAIEFMVDPDLNIATYDAIADLVETNGQIVAYTRKMVAIQTPPNFVRPAGALTIKEVFHRLHQGQDEFYFCARANGQGIQKLKFTNYFSIDSQIPILHVDDPIAGGFFEWWILGLMSQFVGYNQYYAFASNADAAKYYGTP